MRDNKVKQAATRKELISQTPPLVFNTRQPKAKDRRHRGETSTRKPASSSTQEKQCLPSCHPHELALNLLPYGRREDAASSTPAWRCLLYLTICDSTPRLAKTRTGGREVPAKPADPLSVPEPERGCTLKSQSHPPEKSCFLVGSYV